MTEQQADYVAEAMESLNGEPAAIIEQPRSRLVLRDGLDEEWTVAWVKLSTAFKPHIKELKGSPLAVWLYLSLSINKQGVSFPGIRTIAEDTGYSHQGVLDAIAILEKKGYLKVRRGERKFNLYEPEFAAIGRTNEPSSSVNSVDSTRLTGQLLPPDESTFSADESSGVDLNKKEQEKDAATPLSSEELKQANDLVDAIIANSSNPNSWEGREVFLPEHLPLLDWYHRVTGQTCPKSKRKDWFKAVVLWVANNLSIANLQAAYDVDIKWRNVFLSPNQLTDKAIALRAQKQTEVKEYTRLL